MRVRGARTRSAKEDMITYLDVDDCHLNEINSKRHYESEDQENYREVFQRLFKEDVTKNLLTILGHLVLLGFTGDRHIYTECINYMYALKKE